MTFRQSTLALGLLLGLTTAVPAQTVTDSAEKLAQALTHRRHEVRGNAFTALLQKAQSGEDITEATPELLRFANLHYKDRFDSQQLQEYQADALKVLVVIDDEIAGKVLERTGKLVNAYIALKSRDSSTAYKINQVLKRTFPVLHYLNKPEQVKQAADRAEQISPQLIKYEFEVLLPLIYRKYPTGRERIQITELLLQEEFKDRNSWKTRVEKCVFAGLYTATLDEETLTFLTTLPPDNQKAKFRANMLGLLSKRSEKAKQAAIQIMQDEYEDMYLRHAAASGLMAVHSPDQNIYWQADAVLEIKNGFYSEVFDFAPKFSETERREIHKNRDSKKQSRTSPLNPIQKTANVRRTQPAPYIKPQIPQDDLREFQQVITSLMRQAKGKNENGAFVMLLPRTAYDKLQKAHREAAHANRPKLEDLYRGALKQWNIRITSGQIRIVD